jgi:hypothetical protein
MNIINPVEQSISSEADSRSTTQGDPRPLWTPKITVFTRDRLSTLYY